MSSRKAQQIIQGNLAWKTGTPMVPSAGAKIVNQGNTRHVISKDRMKTVFDDMVQAGTAIKDGDTRYRAVVTETPLKNKMWRQHTNEELGIYSYLVAGMGWVHLEAL